MEEARCIKCGRPLSDPESITRGMGPQCAGDTGGRRRKYRSGVRSRSGSSYMAFGQSSAATPTLFGLVGENKQRGEQPIVEELLRRNSGLAVILMQYPTDLIDLVLSAPAAGAIASHVKNYSKKRKPKDSMHPAKILQEIRRMCIDLRLTFWPGMFNHQGQQIACVPYGDVGWRFENSEKVMSRQELESYLSRYGMIRSASR
jgi:Family of unknown function (DUF6011)